MAGRRTRRQMAERVTKMAGTELTFDARSAPANIFLSAAEPSGDLHASNLIRAMRGLLPDASFAGIGGPRMAEAGCRVIDDLTQRAAMLMGTIGALRRGRAALERARQHFVERRPDLVILVDSPVLNLAVARQAKRAGLRTFYYIAPQLWAWGGYRIGKVRRRVDRMAVILPFEVEYFRKRGVEAEFVGHPLMDALAVRTLDEAVESDLRALPRPLVALLPGSRAHVVREVLPGQLAVAGEIRARHPGCTVVISDTGNPAVSREIDRLAGPHRPPPLRLTGRNGEMFSACDLALVASGTTTLEAAYYGCPMIVMYNASRLMYHLMGRWLIGTKYLSLPNILSDRSGGGPVVPEFMPYYTDTAPIAAEALALLDDEPRRREMRRRLLDLVAPLARGNASLQAARAATEMLNRSQ